MFDLAVPRLSQVRSVLMFCPTSPFAKIRGEKRAEMRQNYFVN